MQLQASESQPNGLTDWANAPTLLTLKNDLQASKSAHDIQVGKINTWNDLMQVKGSAAPKKVKGRSSVQPKLIRRQAEWRYSALTEPFLGDDKIFKIKPVTFEDNAGAQQNELVLGWQFRTKLNRVKFIDDYVRSTVDEGTCIVRVGWKRVTTKVKQDVPVFTHVKMQSPDELAAFQQAYQAWQDDPHTFNDTAPPEMKEAISFFEQNREEDPNAEPTVVHITGTKSVDVDKVLINQPTVEVRNPANIYVDPSCAGDLDKAMFVIESFETNKAELLKDGKYKNLDKVNWEANTPLSTPDHETTTPSDGQVTDQLRKKVVAYEYWGFYDIHGTGELVPVVCTWIGDTIIRMELNPYPDQKVPYVVVPYLPVKRELYGEPDAELLEDQQKISGAVMRGMIDLLGRSANGQQGFAKGMLDALNRRRYENGQDYEFNPNINPTNGLIQHKYAELPQSALLMLNLQNQEAESLTGVKSFAGGMSGEAFGQVAAGIRGVLDAASKREMAILRRLAEGMKQIGIKIIAMNAEFMSEEETIRVTNEQFVKVKREDLAGDYDLIVDISTAEIDDAQAKDLAFLLQTIGNSVDSSITLLILSEIARLKRMPDLAHRLSTYKPQPSPEEQQMQQLQLQKAQLEVAELQSRIQLNQANAKKASSDADKTDLDYVEQENGTAHARELQKQQAQAHGNQSLEVTKALTRPVKEGERQPDIEGAIGYNQLSKNLEDA